MQSGWALIEFLGLPDVEAELAKRGGRRAGAGRKPFAGGELVTKSYKIKLRDVELLEQYRARHGFASASEALRHILVDAVYRDIEADALNA